MLAFFNAIKLAKYFAEYQYILTFVPLKASHNKDYSVVKTSSASPICGAFLLQ